MEMRTLDEYLEEIDRWKETAMEKTRSMTPEELVAYYAQVRAQLENELAHPLTEIPAPDRKVAPIS